MEGIFKILDGRRTKIISRMIKVGFRLFVWLVDIN